MTGCWSIHPEFRPNKESEETKENEVQNENKANAGGQQLNTPPKDKGKEKKVEEPKQPPTKTMKIGRTGGIITEQKQWQVIQHKKNRDNNSKSNHGERVQKNRQNTDNHDNEEKAENKNKFDT
uniref:Uncharacterized protein n=1 Tax=Solanum tuberosum TaxID=4113 RepID=M1DL40_SOLTU